MQCFVQPNSIVRRIWGDADLVMLIFGAGAAEFALNRAVDWLFFTGAIPNDPLGRLFSTAAYAQTTIFAEQSLAEQTLVHIRQIHGAVERERGAQIPQWAHRDVLYMLIDYTERVFAALYRPLTPPEQDELYDVFYRVGRLLGIEHLPENYGAWQIDRQHHLANDLAYSHYTKALYAAYRRDLGPLRYWLLRQIQVVLVPPHVHKLLNLPRLPWLLPTTWVYPLLIKIGLRPLMHQILIPTRYVEAVERLQTPTTALRVAH